ncbi:MAG: methyltransferase domain-containing protein [Spirulinaceae cyanobacterium]
MLNETKDFWESKYQSGNTRWDLGKAAPPLVSLLSSPDAPAPGKTVVLGCGRGYDALLFANHGFEVTGVDLAPSAITAAKSSAAKANLSVKFLLRNIFDLTAEFPNYFDYVVEHTCFCAIAPELRKKYLNLVTSLLKPQGKLIGVFFTHNRPSGPPFGSTPQEIRDLFSGELQIRRLDPVTNSVPSRQNEEHLGIFKKRVEID